MKFNRIEDELLILLAQTSIDQNGANRIEEILERGIEWNYFLKNAYYHGLYSLIYSNLQHYSILGLNAEELDQIKQTGRTIVLRSLEYVTELVSILRDLQNNDVPVIPIKGPVLTQLIYGDVGLRMSSDLDILVPPEKIPLAKQILVARGYELIKTTSDDNRWYRKQSGNHHYKFVKNNQFYLELHQALEPGWFYKSDETSKIFWDTSETIACFGITITFPKKEELFLFLCRHGSRHAWTLIKWSCDLAQFLKTYPNFDWDYIIERAEKTNMELLLFSSLYLTNLLYGTVFPESVTKRIEEDSRIQKFVSLPLKAMFLPPDFEVERYWLERLQSIRAQKGGFRKLASTFALLIWKMRPTARDRAVIGLPRYLAFLYYLLRPLRLLVSYIWVFWRHYLERY